MSKKATTRRASPAASNRTIAAATDIQAIAGNIAKLVKSQTDAMVRQQVGAAKSAKSVEEQLRMMFPKPDASFGRDGDKEIRITREGAPEVYKLVWAAFHDGVKTLDGGKVVITETNEGKVKYRENAWTAAKAFIRGEVESFGWNLAHVKRAEAKRGARQPKPFDETIRDRIQKVIDAIKGREDVGNVINCLPHLEKALASIK